MNKSVFARVKAFNISAEEFRSLQQKAGVLTRTVRHAATSVSPRTRANAGGQATDAPAPPARKRRATGSAAAAGDDA